MDLLRGLTGILASPLIVAALFGALSTALLLTGRPRLGRGCVILALAVGYFGATPVLGDALLEPLERQYSALPADYPLAPTSCVVVLGSGFQPRVGIPITAAIDADGLVRIVEGVRLTRRQASAQLIASGGAPPGFDPPARGYAELARDLGIEPSAIRVLDASLNTAGEARAVAQLLGQQSFLLVTSAYHMPRAMKLMRRAGARPIPAPTGQLTGARTSREWARWLPSSGGLARSERALHEYLGLAALSAGLD